MNFRPKDVGILALDIYFPKTYVNQTELEKFDKVSAGKYTKGLGQQNMAFFELYEDICSISLTCVHNLLEKYEISPKEIGRIEIGTETFIDKSKSIKTTLMDLFEKYGNNSIEGVTTTNACYGGTAAFLNSIAWVESTAWDGRYAIVLATDIAVYEKGPARPTGGAGCIAMLIGPNAPIVLENDRSTFMTNAYDFYKPILQSEYPIVDGKFSINCYLNAIDRCYLGLKEKLEKKMENFSLKNVDFCCFHTPFGKMVYKSFQRMAYLDILSNNFDSNDKEKLDFIKKSKNFNDSQVQKFLELLTKDIWNQKCARSLYLSSELGNIYTGALYGCLISLIQNETISLENKRVMMFSYGSGAASTLFLLKVYQNVDFMRIRMNIKENLRNRIKISPAEFTDILQKKENLYGKPNFNSHVNLERLESGAYYLESVDDKYRRKYKRKGGKEYVIEFRNNDANRRLAQIKNQLVQK